MKKVLRGVAFAGVVAVFVIATCVGGMLWLLQPQSPVGPLQPIETVAQKIHKSAQLSVYICAETPDGWLLSRPLTRRVAEGESSSLYKGMNPRIVSAEEADDCLFGKLSRTASASLR